MNKRINDIESLKKVDAKLVFGNDELFDGNKFYQYLMVDDLLFKAYYDCDTDIDCIDYSTPIKIRYANCDFDVVQNIIKKYK